MQAGNYVIVRSDSTLHFTEALAQNAGENENLVPPGAISAGKHTRSRVRCVVILSVENLAWEVWVFGRDTFRTGAIATEMPRGYWEFVATDARRIAATGLYVYYIDGLDLPYQDEDFTGELHLTLVNRSAAAKTAGAAGAVRVDVLLEETLGGGV